MAKKPRVPEPGAVPETPATTMPTPETATDQVDGVAASTAADETSTAEGGAEALLTDPAPANDDATEPAAGSKPAAGDDPGEARSEVQLFTTTRDVLHDGDLYGGGDLIRLTRAQHAPLHAVGAVAEPWDG